MRGRVGPAWRTGLARSGEFGKREPSRRPCSCSAPAGNLPPLGGHRPHIVRDANFRAHSLCSWEAQGSLKSPHGACSERALPPPFQERGPGRWRPGQGPCPLPGRSAWAGQEFGAAAGPGNRGLGLCRPVDLTPSSRPQRPSPQLPPISEFGVRTRRMVSLALGPAARFPHAVRPRLPVSYEPHPPKKAPAPADLGLRSSETNPGRVTRHSACGSFQAPPAALAEATRTGLEAWRPRLFPCQAERQSYTRNFAKIPSRDREAQFQTAPVTCAEIRGAQGRQSWAAPPLGVGEVAASWALCPNVQDARQVRAGQAPSLLNLPGTEGLSPLLPQEAAAQHSRERSEVPKPFESWVSSTRSLDLPELAPRAGDTSTRICSRRLLELRCGQCPPALPLGVERTAPCPAPARPSPAPPWRHPLLLAAPAPACGARARIQLQSTAQWRTPARGFGVATAPTPRLL